MHHRIGCFGLDLLRICVSLRVLMDMIAVQLIRQATLVFGPIQYKGATNKRRFYEEVELPRNLVVLGDAVCTFNPCVAPIAIVSP